VITEVAINPCVFDKGCYSDPALCKFCMDAVWAALERDAMARNLRDGDWGKFVIAGARSGPLETTARHMVKKLATKNRFTAAPPELADEPDDYEKWCEESKLSDSRCELAGIIVSEAVVAGHTGHAKVKSVEKLNKARWWQDRSLSMRTDRTTAGFLSALGIVLSYSRSLMFVDPYLNPAKGRYSDFISLLAAAKRPVPPQPKIEIHRVMYEGSGPNRTFPAMADFESDFRGRLDQDLKDLGLTVEVFIWDDSHDRYLITDIIGISVSNGFDVNTDSADRNILTRVSLEDKESVMEEYDPSRTTLHTLKHRFSLG